MAALHRFDLVIFFARKGRGFFELPPEETPFLTLPNYGGADAEAIPLGASSNRAGGKLNARGPPAATLELHGCYAQVGKKSPISHELKERGMGGAASYLAFIACICCIAAREEERRSKLSSCCRWLHAWC